VNKQLLNPARPNAPAANKAIYFYDAAMINKNLFINF
jgi:hypothetical protein